MTTVGRKTGPKPRFHIEDVITTALSLGLDTFTLSDVARALKVSTPSLYRVVSTREELVHLCLRHAAKELQLPPETQSWQDQLRFYVDELWSFAERHPGTTKAIVDTPGAHIHVQQYFEDFGKSLTKAGFPGNTNVIDFTLDFLGDITLMTHIQVTTFRASTEHGITGFEQAKQIFDAAAKETGGATHFPPNEAWIERGYLERKVEFIIRGLEAKLAPEF
ncbi:hypothetical protein CFREI_04095 [Corynebacterium freiburgense]|nr:hypothetical protein CFREI_04095 [Corynebacterium freiburgense]